MPSMAEAISKNHITTVEHTTIADGIAVKTPGELTFEIIKICYDIVTVGEDEIANAILLHWNGPKSFPKEPVQSRPAILNA